MHKVSPQQRQVQQTLLAPLLRLWSDPERRRKFLLWLVGGTSGVLALALVLESSRAVCRTPAESAQLVARVCLTVVKTLLQYVARGCQPKFPKWTLRFELLRGIMRLVSNTHGERIADASHATIIRGHSERVGSFLGWFACQLHGLKLEPVEVNGLEHLWLKSASPTASESSKRLVVLFYHGGGFAVLSPRMYISFCSALVSAIKKEFAAQGRGSQMEDVSIDVFLANYRKAPEFSFPTQPEDTVAAYEYLLRHEKIAPSQIIVAGDSAGGGLVMSTLLRVRDGEAKLPPPLAAIVACPLVDLTGDEAEAEHCVLSSSITVASRVSYHPTHKDRSTWGDASSVHCDLKDLPPVFLQAATQDYLYPHSRRLAAKAEADGVTNWEVDVHEGVPHVFMVFPSYVLPYASVAIQNMAVFAAKQFHHALAMNRKEEVMDSITVTSKSVPSAA
ncbi:hypothetical protein BBJ28_00025065 [Nothophytophthora sp. Chile5]|nr:hypothetical protein BBJ28_00025065 [Nothophytophthora sp. Chile5]